MNKTKRKRAGLLTMNDLAEYLAIKFEDQLATLPPAERAKREAAFKKTVAEARARQRATRRIAASHASRHAR